MTQNKQSSPVSASETSGAEIVFDHVTKSYPGQKSPAVKELSFRIPAGELVAFVGPSGCGKTEVPRVLFLGICLDFYYCLRRVLVPKFGFHFDRGSVSQALVKPRLVPP